MQKKQGFRPASFILCVSPYGFRLQLILHGRHGKCLPVVRHKGFRLSVGLLGSLTGGNFNEAFTVAPLGSVDWIGEKR